MTDRLKKNLVLTGLAAIGIVVVIHNLYGLPFLSDPSERTGFDYYKEAMFYEKTENGKVQCNLCFRECIIPEGQVGFCQNRENRDGVLYTLIYGNPSAVHVDPVEKEPMHHFLPGSKILCIGTASCNFRCKFCHNWHMSQRRIDEISHLTGVDADQIVQRAIGNRIPTISFTYNEPTVFYEYMFDISKHAKQNGLNVIFHTNGSINPEPLRKLLQYVDGVTVDLKGFNEDYYKVVSGGDLDHVLNTLKIIREEGVWLEIVNLVVPTMNDDLEEIREMCKWIKENLGGHTPLHFSRFFPAYRLTDLHPTPIETLEKAHRIAGEEGLEFVSVGNVPGHENNSTFCPNCNRTLIHRHHFSVHSINITDGRCDFCEEPIAGVWE